MATAKKLPSGNWRVRIFSGKDADGKNQYKSFTAETKKQAEFDATSYLIDSKKIKKNEDITVGEAIDKYIENKTSVLSPTSIATYKSIKENRMQSIMKVDLENLTSDDLQKAINQESTHLTPKSVKSTYGLISSVIKVYRPEWLPKVTLPALKRHIIELPNAETILKIVIDTEIELPVLLAMWLSLRLSEVKGLKKEDIKDGYLTVNRIMVIVDRKEIVKATTKTYNSTRKLKVPDYILKLINATEGEYVVSMTGAAIYKRFTRLLKQNNLEHMRFHDLRHLNASVMSALGVPDKYAMERGGWSTTDTLQRVYQHTFSKERQDIDKKIDDYFNGIIKTI